MINFFWRTRNVLARIRLAATPLVPSLLKDLAIILIPENTDIFQALRNFAVKLGIANKSLKDISETEEKVVIQQFAEPASKPLVFASFCRGADAPGHGKFNGGVKELNYLVKLLREQGYEAYVVTYDGSYDSWLLDHQPHISMDDYNRLITYNQNIRCVTSWAIAEAFIKNSPSLYFWDMELCWTIFQFWQISIEKKSATLLQLLERYRLGTWLIFNATAFCFLIWSISLNGFPFQKNASLIGLVI